MTTSSAIQLVNTPELVYSIDNLDLGQGQSLLEINNIGSVAFLRTEVSIVDGPENDETALIGTIIKANDMMVDLEELEMCLATNIHYGVEEGRINPIGPHHIGNGAISLCSMENDTETLIVRAQSQTWFVRSTMQLPEYDVSADVERLPDLVKEHVFAANALLSALAGRYFGDSDDSDSPHNFFLQMEHSPELPYGVVKDPFDQFIGIDSIVKQLKRFVKLANMTESMLQEHEITREQALLLQGPSGVGKTELVNSLVESLGAKKRHIRFAEISGGNAGEWAKNIQRKIDETIKEAETKGIRILIHFDEADGLITPGNEGVARNISSVLKDSLDKVRLTPNIFVAFTTNPNRVLDPTVFNDKRVPLRIEIQRSSEETLRRVLSEVVLNNAATVYGKTGDLENAMQHHEQLVDVDGIAKLLYEREFTAGDLVEIIKNIRKKHLLNQLEESDEEPKPVILTDARLRVEIANAENRRAITNND